MIKTWHRALFCRLAMAFNIKYCTPDGFSTLYIKNILVTPSFLVPFFFPKLVDSSPLRTEFLSALLPQIDLGPGTIHLDLYPGVGPSTPFLALHPRRCRLGFVWLRE